MLIIPSKEKLLEFAVSAIVGAATLAAVGFLFGFLTDGTIVRIFGGISSKEFTKIESKLRSAENTITELEKKLDVQITINSEKFSEVNSNIKNINYRLANKIDGGHNKELSVKDASENFPFISKILGNLEIAYIDGLP